ncbi:hypothetical protein [Methylosinus sp. RM1]|uniref:hypothetical protein n=1 Tax=Methylosinus sp. RM1 TaxID=2583817 RepID=UPI00140C9410|nr:hypothetical protein [Methylosinus sp. RM1]
MSDAAKTTLTPERRAELTAKYCRKPAAPVKVVVDEGRVVAPAAVRVSPADPNFRGNGGFVRIDMETAERQRARAEADRRAEARRRREIDPFNFGHWGALED